MSLDSENKITKYNEWHMPAKIFFSIVPRINYWYLNSYWKELVCLKGYSAHNFETFPEQPYVVFIFWKRLTCTSVELVYWVLPKNQTGGGNFFFFNFLLSWLFWDEGAFPLLSVFREKQVCRIETMNRLQSPLSVWSSLEFLIQPPMKPLLDLYYFVVCSHDFSVTLHESYCCLSWTKLNTVVICWELQWQNGKHEYVYI